MAIFRMLQDYDSMSPRDWDNLGHMICDHPTYNLGDQQGEFIDLWRAVVDSIDDTVIRQLCLDIVKHNKCAKNEYKYELSRVPPCDKASMRVDALDELAEWTDLQQYFMNAVETVAVVLPLYLYDHGGVTMKTGGFCCPWDSGIVGVIYVTHERIKQEYGNDDRAIEKAVKVLETEVQIYSQYLEGDVWGYVIEDDDGDCIDSCFGFYGTDLETNGMLDHIPKEYHELAKEYDIFV